MDSMRTPRLLAIAVLLTSPAAAQVNHAKPVNSLNAIISDMTLPHEGRPHGVPDSYDWVRGPVIGMGNKPPTTWHAITAWGQLYEDAAGNPARNTRVQIRRIRTYVLSKQDGKWHLLQSSEGVEGAAYREDFVDDINKKPDLRHEPDGSVAVKAGGGYNFHFWPQGGRASLDPSDVAGILTTVQARLVVDHPSQPDGRAKARYLLSMGADYWQDRQARWDHFRTNGGMATGRFKYVTVEWRAFNCTTLTGKELRRRPPPFD
jgi:hypothetical protein